jgi:hypothetical protein
MKIFTLNSTYEYDPKTEILKGGKILDEMGVKIKWITPPKIGFSPIFDLKASCTFKLRPDAMVPCFAGERMNLSVIQNIIE